MPFNIPGVPSSLDARSMGNFDLGAALTQGFKNFQTMSEAVNTPKRLSEALLAQQLQNKINKSKADYAERNEAAGLANTQAGTQNLLDTHGLTGLNRKILEQKIAATDYENQLRDRIKAAATGGYRQPSTVTEEEPEVDNGLKSEIASAPGAIPAATYKDNLTAGLGQRSNENVTSKGNPSLYYLDDMWDSDPMAAAYIKKHFNVEKKVTPRFDPKTGVTSVVTQYPSGRVEVETTGVKASNGKSPLTNKTVSTLQSAKQALPELRRVINALKDTPSPAKLPYGIPYKEGERKKHNDLVQLGKDLYAKVKGLTTTDKALQTAAEVLDRQDFVSDKDYHAALDNTLALLDQTESEINQTLKSGISTNKNSEKKQSNNNIVEWTRDENGKPVRKK